jgi:hypothetical protein
MMRGVTDAPTARPFREKLARGACVYLVWGALALLPALLLSIFDDEGVHVPTDVRDERYWQGVVAFWIGFNVYAALVLSFRRRWRVISDERPFADRLGDMIATTFMQ